MVGGFNEQQPKKIKKKSLSYPSKNTTTIKNKYEKHIWTEQNNQMKRTCVTKWWKMMSTGKQIRRKTIQILYIWMEYLENKKIKE